MDLELARIEHGKLTISRILRKMDGVLPIKHGVILRGPKTTPESCPATELFMTLSEAQALAAALRIDIPANGKRRHIRVQFNAGRDFAIIEAMGMSLFVGDLVAEYSLREDLASLVEDMARMKFDQFAQERRGDG